MKHWGVCIFLKDFVYLFLERGEGREKERERNISMWLPLTYFHPGTWPATQTCALAGNWTGDPVVHRSALNPVHHISQHGVFVFFYDTHLCDWLKEWGHENHYLFIFLSSPENIFSLLLEKKEGRKREKHQLKERSIDWLPTSDTWTGDQGSNPQCRHVPWPGIEPSTLLLWNHTNQSRIVIYP